MSRLALLAAVIGLVACGSPARPVVQEPPSNQTVSTDEVFIDGRVLLIHGPDAKTRRALPAHLGVMRLRLDGESYQGDGSDDRDVRYDALFASETRGNRVRVRADHDNARLLVWIDRADLRSVILDETGVASSPSDDLATTGGIGVRLRPGARIETLRDGAPGRRGVTIEDEDLVVSGEVDSSTVGTLWIPGPNAASEPDHFLDAEMPIRAAADEQATVLATPWRPVEIQLLGAVVAGWVEIATTGPHVIARGFVPESAVLGPAPDVYGSEWTSQARVGRRDALQIPAGTCLYDRPDGEVVGVEIETEKRVGTATSGWATVAVETWWGTVEVAVHEAPGGMFEQCATTAELGDMWRDRKFEDRAP